jgi:hypothetical protein
MLDMIICKGSHREIGMIIVRLVAHMHTGKASIAGSSFKVFGEELALFVKVVAGSLVSISIRHKSSSSDKERRKGKMEGKT